MFREYGGATVVLLNCREVLHPYLIMTLLCVQSLDQHCSLGIPPYSETPEECTTKN